MFVCADAGNYGTSCLLTLLTLRNERLASELEARWVDINTQGS